MDTSGTRGGREARRSARRAVVPLVVLLAPCVALASTPSVAVARSSPRAVVTVASPSVSRVAGVDRYATSVAASRAAFPTGTRAEVIYLVSGTSPWHSLSATAAAVRQGGGVLLTRPDGIPSVVASELARLDPGRVVVVGPADTVSSTVVTQAKRYAPEVVRLAGSSRYQTAEALVRDAFDEPVGHAWLATGRVWTDGIVAGPAAAARLEPLLTVDGAAPSLPAAPLALLRDLEVTSVTVVGGTAAVSAGIERRSRGSSGRPTLAGPRAPTATASLPGSTPSPTQTSLRGPAMSPTAATSSTPSPAASSPVRGSAPCTTPFPTACPRLRGPGCSRRPRPGSRCSAVKGRCAASSARWRPAAASPPPRASGCW